MSSAAANSYDVAITGAGPAGTSLAIRLANAGHKVLLVEQKQFPRAKLCGEFISPECLAHFSQLGVLEQMTLAAAAISRTVFYARSGRALIVPNEWFQPGSYALGLSRAEMDNVLLERARAVGVDVRENTAATDLLFEGDTISGLRLKTQGRTFEIGTKLAIDATGRSRALVRHLARTTGKTKLKRADFVAFKTHLTGASVAEGDCEIYAYRGGYGGCVRVTDDIHNLCFIVPASTAKRHNSDPSEILQQVVLGNLRAAESLSNARPVNGWLAVPIERYGRTDLAPARGLLTVGDASAFIDPFTGSGILLALESAQVASAVIKKDLLNDDEGFSVIRTEYASRYAAAFNSRHRVSSMLRRAAFVPYLAGVVIRGLSVSDRLARRVAEATRHS